MHKVQDYKLGLMVDGIPAMVRGGGRGAAAPLTEMFALLLSPGRILGDSLHFVSSSTTLMRL